MRHNVLWIDDLPEKSPARPPLPGPLDVDVAIVGAGLTGLWTAYYLIREDPGLSIAVLERESVGAGASSRNGGWVTNFSMAVDHDHYANADEAHAMQQAVEATVDEIGRVTAREGIACDFVKAGQITIAANAAQAINLRREYERLRRLGHAEGDYHWLEAEEVKKRIGVASCVAGTFNGNCATVQPARLVQGLARTVEQAGVRIFHDTPVRAIKNGIASTPAGSVKAGVVVRATEGYTSTIEGFGRDLAPIYAFAIATAPIPAQLEEAVHWQGGETLLDMRRSIFFAMRDRDGRIVIGGLRYGYHFASAIDRRFEHDERAFGVLREQLARLFPALKGVAIDYRWGGVLGVPLGVCPDVAVDRARKLAWAGGYVGEGVSFSNLAARVMRDQILGKDTPLSRIRWSDSRAMRWPPEPFRWCAVQAVNGLLRFGDRRELATGRPSRAVDRVIRIVGW